MKTFIIENNIYGNQEENPVWSFLPDSALCNAGKPFFIPEDALDIKAFISPIIKITRLGKSIAPRFSSRYYSEIAPAIHFRDMEKRKRLIERGLPIDMSQAFDRSMIIGDFTSALQFLGDNSIILLKNGEKAEEWNEYELAISIDRLFQAISAENTLKMGDYLIPGLSNGVEIKISDELELRLGDKTLLNIQIK